MNNYLQLLSIKYKHFFLSFIISIIIIITLILSFFIKTYSSYRIKGVYQDDLIVSVPLENSDAVNKGEYLTINQQRYSYNIKSISEIQVLNYINYQDYIISVDKIFKKNEVIEITFYYKKQRIIQKIIDIIF